jgi:hypothetical protein
MKKPSSTTDANWTAANSIQIERIRNARMTTARLLAKANAPRRIDIPPRNF